MSGWSTRSLVIGLAASSALIAGAQHLGAQAIVAHNSKALVDYTAEQIELQHEQDRVPLSASVDLSQAALFMRTAHTNVAVPCSSYATM